MVTEVPLTLQFSKGVKEPFELKQRMHESYERTISMNQMFWAEADIDSRFKAGDETLWTEMYGDLPAFRRRLFSFNRIRRICNLITGFQRKTRKSMVVVPIENADEVTADQFSKLLMWSAEREGMLHTISEAFDGAITTGMNLLSLWLDFNKDPINGDLKLDCVGYNSYLIDPFFKKPDLSDCNFVWTRKWLTKEQCKALLPFRKKEIDSLDYGSKDGKFNFAPESFLHGYEDHFLTYDEYWYKDTRKQQLLVDMRSGQTMEWKGSQDDLNFFLSTHGGIEVVTNRIPTCKLGIVVQGHILYHGKNPLGIDSYPFVPVFAYRDPNLPHFSLRCQGIVRSLRSSQALYNHRRRVELDILESQVSSGYKFKENALVDRDDVFKQGQGKGIAIKQDANLDDVQPIQPPDVPPGMMQLSEQLAMEIQEISGVNEELMGTAEDDRGVGLLSMLRQGAGLTILQGLFDQLDQAQKLLGRICLDTIQNNFTVGKVQRIIGEVPTDQFFNRDFQIFDVSVEEGLNTTTQKQIQFRQLLELRQMDIPVPNDVLIQSSTLQNKKMLLDAIANEQKQQAEIQAQKSQIEDQMNLATIKDLEARAQANAGLSLERSSRVQENRAFAIERLSESDKDKEIGLVNRIKAIKELENIDLEKLKKLIELSEMMKEKESLDKEKERLQVVSPNPEEVAAITGNPEALVARKNVIKQMPEKKKADKLPLETIKQKPKEVTDGL